MKFPGKLIKTGSESCNSQIFLLQLSLILILSFPLGRFTILYLFYTWYFGILRENVMKLVDSTWWRIKRNGSFLRNFIWLKKFTLKPTVLFYVSDIYSLFINRFRWFFFVEKGCLKPWSYFNLVAIIFFY